MCVNTQHDHYYLKSHYYIKRCERSSSVQCSRLSVLIHLNLDVLFLICLEVSAKSRARRTLLEYSLSLARLCRNLQPDDDDDSRGIPLSIEGNTISAILSEHHFLNIFNYQTQDVRFILIRHQQTSIMLKL